MKSLVRGRGTGDDRWLARACAIAIGAAVAWTAESYESDLNVPRPAVLAVAPSAPPQPHRGSSRLVWIFVDGLRLDASRRMPVLNRLRTEGIDVVARSEFPTFSGPNYIAQASGIEPAASGALSNDYPGQVQLDSVFRRAKLSGRRTAILTTEDHDALLRVYPSWVDDVHVADPLDAVPTTDLLFVHVNYTDETAHDFGIRSTEYRAAVASVDDYIGRVVATLDPMRDVLVVSSDHGHLTEGGHGGTEPEVRRIPIVVWGAGVAPGGTRKVGRSRDVGPTIASLLGMGPLSHATGRPLVGGDEATVRQRAAVLELIGDPGRRPTNHLPLPILFAVGICALLARRARLTTRDLVTAPIYALCFTALLLATRTTSFSVSNLTAPFAIRVTTLCMVSAIAQLLVGGRSSVTPAAFVTSLAVLAVALVGAWQPLAPAVATFRFLPIPALTSLAFISLMTAAVGTPERKTAKGPLMAATERDSGADRYPPAQESEGVG